MKIRHVVFMLLAFMIACPVQAQDWDLYGTLGYTPSVKAGNVRIGVMKNHLGGEVYLKSDLNRLKSMDQIDGKPYRLSVMGGLSYRPINTFMLTVNAGYGASGTYMVDALHTSYGAVDIKKGVEAGLSLNYIMFNYIILYGGMTFHPIGNENSISEMSLGIGLMF